MKAHQANYDLKMNHELEKRLHLQADRAVLERSVTTIPMYLALFLAIVWATPIARRFPNEIIGFGIFSLLLCLVRYWIVIAWRKVPDSQSLSWHRLFLLSHYLTSASWGLFCCLTVAFLELGWTSFFVLLITIGICAASIPTLAPKFSLSRWHLVLMFVPSLLATWLFVGGLKGYSLALFFLGFFVLMLTQSKVQNIQYWRGIRDQARIQAMIDALPGTLSWVSSDLKYLGVNRHLARLWNMPQEKFMGNEMGFSSKATAVREFVRHLFASDSEQESREMPVQVEGDQRTYYMVAAKYNHNTEAVILGIDVTEYKKYYDEALMRRRQSAHVAKLASLGEVAGDLAKGVNSRLTQVRSSLSTLKPGTLATGAMEDLEDKLSKIERLASVFHRFSFEEKDSTVKPIKIVDLVDDLCLLHSDRFQTKEIEFSVTDYPKDLSVNCSYNLMIEVLLHLLGNSYDAVKDVPKSWVRLEVKKLEFGIEIAVVDSGKGISEAVRDRLFQSHFSTKGKEDGGGFGLNQSKRMIEAQGGILSLDTASPNTRFVISLPDEPVQVGNWMS